jgi:hypothetical protein
MKGRKRQSAGHTKMEPEFELWDTKAPGDGFFEVQIDYAKNSIDDILIRVTATNCRPVLAPLHILPTPWSMELRGTASNA